jgi:histidinol-phosphate aminotransferase
LNLLRPAVRAMPPYVPGEQIPDLVKLNTNEGAYPPSPRVMQALAAIADESLRLYPDPVSTALRAAAAARFGVPAECIIAGNGSDDCLTMLYRGFLDAGERAACPWPTYGLYDTLASLQGVPYHVVENLTAFQTSWPVLTFPYKNFDKDTYQRWYCSSCLIC